MSMRVKLSIGEVEIRVQERRVISAAAFLKGKQIAGAQATCAPQDKFDLKEGETIAVSRLATELHNLQVEELRRAQAAIQTAINDALKANGAVRASFDVKLKTPINAQTIVFDIMKRLDARRLKAIQSECIRSILGLVPGFGLFAKHAVNPSNPLTDIAAPGNYCEAPDPDGFTCTRPKGHGYIHVAHTSPDGSTHSRKWPVSGE